MPRRRADLCRRLPRTSCKACTECASQPARELYRVAGYSDEKPLEVEVRYNTGEAHNRIAVAIAAMWKETLGVKTSLYAEEIRALLASIQARTDTEIFRSSWVGDFDWTLGMGTSTGMPPQEAG